MGSFLKDMHSLKAEHARLAVTKLVSEGSLGKRQCERGTRWPRQRQCRNKGEAGQEVGSRCNNTREEPLKKRHDPQKGSIRTCRPNAAAPAAGAGTVYQIRSGTGIQYKGLGPASR